MKKKISRSAIAKRLGKQVCVVKSNGELLHGKLVKVRGNRVFLQPMHVDGKKARTSALVPLVLFDLLAVEEAAGGPFGPYGPYGGPGPYGPFGGPFGYQPYGGYYPGPGLF